MQEVSEITMQTPIEIALGVDENGMTTVRKLYAFLELSPSNYSKWCKTNITENGFAEENVDYWAFVLNDEWGGQATTDYRLTAHFVKKLSCKGNGARAEEAREYFTTVEEKTKEEVVNRSQASPQKICEKLLTFCSYSIIFVVATKRKEVIRCRQEQVDPNLKIIKM